MSDTPRTDAVEREDENDDTVFDTYEIAISLARQLERELAEAKKWRDELNGWGDTPEIVDAFIKGQQARIHAVQDIEKELASARALIERIAKQKPEKPDYWTECSQCRDNINEADDIINPPYVAP